MRVNSIPDVGMFGGESLDSTRYVKIEISTSRDTPHFVHALVVIKSFKRKAPVKWMSQKE